MKKPVFIIAEAGVNHNGQYDLAIKMIDCAVEAGVDAIKFQTFKSEKLVSSQAEMAEYQVENIGKSSTQLEMLKKLELSYESFRALKSYCDDKGILFLSTPFEEESICFLDKLMPIYKIPSGEINNFPYLRAVASKNKPVILSTGMSNLSEVEKSISVLLEEKGDLPITLLHCTTNYPTPFEEVNLMAMQTMACAFKLPVGYSDHTQGIEVPIAAVAMGATVIEKHFTLDKSMEGPDHKASLDPDELKAMVKAIRNIEAALGSGLKKPSASEEKMLLAVRKSLIASRKIAANEVISAEEVCIKRPGTGIAPEWIDQVVGKKAKVGFEKDEVISWDKLY